ncbi:hypothetical protein Hanom_Chr03g00261441 [Helianthus anomalus]
MKMTRFQTFWTQMRKNKHLDESRKNGQTSGTEMAFQKKNDHWLEWVLHLSPSVEHESVPSLPMQCAPDSTHLPRVYMSFLCRICSFLPTHHPPAVIPTEI